MQIVIDFETVDYGLRDGLGPGWPWHACKILGCGIKIEEGDTYYETNVSKIIEIVRQADTIIAHNAQYEAGILKMLGIDIKHKKFFCTKIGASLYNNLLPSNSLDYLSQTFLGASKQTNELVFKGAELGLYEVPNFYEDPDIYKGGDAKILKKLKTWKKKMLNQVWDNLDRLQNFCDVVEKYCIKDVDLTYEMHKQWLRRVDNNIYEYFCKLINVTTDMRAEGIPIDVKEVYKTRIKLEEVLRPLEAKLWDKFGYFNYNSPVQVKAWAKDKLGLSGVKTDEGTESFGKEWIKAFELHEDVQLFAKIKETDKMISFCNTLVEHEKGGKIYPNMNILQARTGRFSCSNPNVQQIPSRSDEYASLLRGLFKAREGEEWFSLDFSSQEPRLQIHYAEQIGSKFGKILADMYRDNPDMDLYSTICDMVKENADLEIDRSTSKVLSLALSYGMGKDKGAKMLNLPVKDYTRIRDGYFKAAPYLKELNRFCQQIARERGYLYTILRRKVQKEDGAEYKALNSLIQGSAFDQTAAAMIKAYYDYDIIPLSVIHDEINISSGDKKTAEHLQEIMETCIIMNIPSKADIGVGTSWAEAK